MFTIDYRPFIERDYSLISIKIKDIVVGSLLKLALNARISREQIYSILDGLDCSEIHDIGIVFNGHVITATSH